MSSILNLSEKAAENVNELISAGFKLERENAKLKQVIRMMAAARAIDADTGAVTMQFSQEDADFIKEVCEEFHVFGLNYNDPNEGEFNE